MAEQTEKRGTTYLVSLHPYKETSHMAALFDFWEMQCKNNTVMRWKDPAFKILSGIKKYTASNVNLQMKV